MKRLLTAAIALTLVGCSRQQDRTKEIEDKLARSNTQIEALKNDLAELKKETESLTPLSAAVAKLTNEVEWQKLQNNLKEIAYLTPGSEGYSAMQIDIGALVVSLENVEPYANGSRVSLSFGNTTGSALTGVETDVEYGSVAANGSVDNANAKSKKASFTEEFPQGAWTKVTLVLDGLPPEKLGFVRLRNLTHTGISLRRTPAK